MTDKDEKAKEKWMGWLALSTAIMAVLAALTTLYMGKYSSRAIMSQGLESNEWAYYQAKSIKQHSFEMGMKSLELQFRSQKGLPSDVAADYEKDKAEGIAKTKLKAQEMGGNFAYALIFLQIAIMLASIASLTKRHYLWHIALVCTVGWLFFFLDAWLLFY
jgi:hypothetical protein